jgi:trypsin
VRTASLQPCQSNYKGIFPVTDDEICVGVNDGGKGACACGVDQGGPVADKTGTLVGVISYGKGCAQAGYPKIDIRVGAYLDWINSKLA